MKLQHGAQSDPGILSHPILLNTGLCALWAGEGYKTSKRCRYKYYTIPYTFSSCPEAASASVHSIDLNGSLKEI